MYATVIDSAGFRKQVNFELSRGYWQTKLSKDDFAATSRGVVAAQRQNVLRTFLETIFCLRY